MSLEVWCYKIVILHVFKGNFTFVILKQQCLKNKRFKCVVVDIFSQSYLSQCLLQNRRCGFKRLAECCNEMEFYMEFLLKQHFFVAKMCVVVVL